ncbi:hypothetical protein ACH6EH_02570 [Paenibacillus sp. JSM ZJ436]|uniref:hypothetical protein n=1 Tax=Paenibacillus sp. JSM ZJ436 TaxID=3376190 RepID=UPI0037935AB2
MRKSILLVQMLLCSMLLISCSVPERTNQGNEPEEVLSGINISIYNDNSIKPQPELFDVESEADLLSTTVREIENADPAPVTIPTIDEINRILILEFTYEKKGETTSKTDYYIMIWDNSEKYYIKKFTMTRDFYYDKYDERAKEKILQSVGSDNWRSILPLTILTN